MMSLTLPIIGTMHSPYMEKFGIPRQPNLVEVESYIELHAPYDDELAFEGIESFSHLWLLWQFHDNKHSNEPEKFRAQVRPPRLGGNKKIGVFATRSMYRPSPVGLSVVKFKALKRQGKTLRLYVTGSDLLHGTPIIDIKPYIQYSDAILDATSGYAQDQPPRKIVIWQDNAQQQKQQLTALQLMNEQYAAELEQVLSLDPRPAYQDDPSRIYKMKFAGLDVSFAVNESTIEIIGLDSLN